MVSAIMVSYTRARAESLIGSCRVGFMERPERLVLVIIGALFNRMAPVLWIIAVLSTITVIHRIHYTWVAHQWPGSNQDRAGGLTAQFTWLAGAKRRPRRLDETHRLAANLPALRTKSVALPLRLKDAKMADVAVVSCGIGLHAGEVTFREGSAAKQFRRLSSSLVRSTFSIRVQMLFLSRNRKVDSSK